MKKTNPDRVKTGKSPQQAEYVISCGATGSASSARKRAGSGVTTEDPTTPGATVDWSRYCDSRLKQFCMR